MVHLDTLFSMPAELLGLLTQRLDFAEFFYRTGVHPFNEVKRMIEQGNDPYVDRRGEWADEPAFLKEFEDADLGAEFIGVSALAFVQSVFYAYLRRIVAEIGGQKLVDQVPRMGKGSLFQNYRELFLQCKIDWAESGVDLDFLEQSVLARNDFFHNVDLLSAYIYQSHTHSTKHPDSAFRDPGWGPDIPRITVTEATLHSAVDALRAVAAHIEKAM
jgi:hypothetical protein